MNLLKLIIRDSENKKYIIDYYYADVLLRIFTILWIGYVIFSYHENLNRPESLYEPIIWVQKWFMPTQPSLMAFYAIVIFSISLSIFTIINKQIVYRGILFLLLLWLNAVKWNYNFFSAVGHLFLLAHFFSIFIPPLIISKFNNDAFKIKQFSYAIRWSYAGILITYTMAGTWKFIALFYKIIFHPNKINWMHENAVELNAIVSARLWDEMVSITMLNIYDIPYIWQIATLFIFCFQLIAVLGAFHKKVSFLVLTSLLSFHIYNMFFINTSFFVSSIVLLIILFPYHLFSNEDYSQNV